MHFPQNSRRRSGRRLTAKAGLTVAEFRKQARLDAEAGVAEAGETVPPVGVGWRQGPPPRCAALGGTGLGWATVTGLALKIHKKHCLQYIGRGLTPGISACVPMPATTYRQGAVDHVEQRPSTTRLVAFSPVG